MTEFLQELGFLMELLSGARTKTPPNLLLLFQWGVLFFMLGRIFLGWVRLEKLADTPGAPTGADAAAYLREQMQKWWRRGCVAVAQIGCVYLFWLVMLDSLMSTAAMYIAGLWAIALWLLNSNVHRMKSVVDVPSRANWTVQVRNLSMSLVVFVIYCMFVQSLSADFVSEQRQAFYGVESADNP